MEQPFFETEVKNRVIYALNENKISVNRLATSSGISTRTLNDQVNGNSKISASTLVALANYCQNVSAEWLLRGTGEMYLTEDKGKPSGKPQDLTGKPQEQTSKPQEPKTYTGDTIDKDELIESLKARIAEQENYIADLRFMARLDKKQ